MGNIMAAAKKKAAGKSRKRASSGGPVFADNKDVKDKISRYLDAKKLVPKRFQGSDEFLDIVAWNIRYFDHKDPDRIAGITDVLDTMNADVFVLTEIAKDGALDDVVDALAKRKAGFYSTFYGTTGDEQRVVMLWDRNWVRSKRPPLELFTDNPVTIAENGRKADVFPRLPVWGHFEVAATSEAEEGFTFELVGLHLKSQMKPRDFKGTGRYGIKQRTMAARKLADWLEAAEEHFDEDIIMVGDWNASTEKEEWEPIRALEKSAGVSFSRINDPKIPTHLARLNKSGGGGSRLDLHLITESADAVGVPNKMGVVIQWSFFDDLAGLDKETRDKLKAAMRLKISDHLPVASRFYLTDARGD